MRTVGESLEENGFEWGKAGSISHGVPGLCLFRVDGDAEASEFCSRAPAIVSEDEGGPYITLRLEDFLAMKDPTYGVAA